MTYFTNAFVAQYNNYEIQTDQFDLQKGNLKSWEKVREYAERWRAEACDVQPPLSNKS